jgi:tetratricopeptide (TPR) repeat protein
MAAGEPPQIDATLAAPPTRGMRRALHSLPALALGLLTALPIVLFVANDHDPVDAVRIARAIAGAAPAALGLTSVLAFALALLWPPFPATIRLWIVRISETMRTDRGPMLRAVAELRSFESAARHLEAGRAANACRDHRTAIPHLARAIELERDSIAAHYQLGVALFELGALQPAVQALTHVVAIDPSHAFGDALLRLARARQLGGDRVGARDLLVQHQREHGGNRKSHHWLGLAHLATGDREAARAALQVAASKDKKPRTAEENWHRAKALVLLWRLGSAGGGGSR